MSETTELRDALDWTLDYIEGIRDRTMPPLAEPFLSERIARYRTLLDRPAQALDVGLLERALQANQDRTFLDVNHHRHHCGGTCARAIAREADRLAASDPGGGQ